MSARSAAVVVGTAAIVAAPIAWLAGEQHRENCVSQHRTSCSVLPWDSGECEKSTRGAAGGAIDWSTARPATDWSTARPVGTDAVVQRRAKRIQQLLCEQP